MDVVGNSVAVYSLVGAKTYQLFFSYGKSVSELVNILVVSQTLSHTQRTPDLARIVYI